MRNVALDHIDRQTALLLVSLREQAREWFRVAETKVRRREGATELTPIARFALGVGQDFAGLADDLEIEASGGLQ